MQSELQSTYPGIVTRDIDWKAFFRTQIWSDIKYILSEDLEWGMEKLLGDKVQDTAEINRLRGKVSAYRELIKLDESIFAMINPEALDEDEEEIEDE